MKTILVPRGNQSGSVLVVGLIITFILGVMLASYLLLTRGQNLSVVRSQIWNNAFVLTEAGVEDALAMMNQYNGYFDTLYNWTNSTSLTAGNWSTPSPNVYYTRRFIGADFYDVYITNFNNRPTVHAVGTVTWNVPYASAPQGFLATVGVVNPSGGTHLNRKVEVRTKVDPLFNFAMAAEHTIDLNGNRITTDSFDSSTDEYSTNGQYDEDKNKDGGDVVTNDTVEDSLDLGNANIKGLVKTGPGGTASFNANGSVGDDAWVDGGNTGIQDGHFADDMNVVWDPPLLPPADPIWAPVSVNPNVLVNFTTNGLTYRYVILRSGDYMISDFTLTRGILIAPNAHVRIWITGSVNLGGSDEIRIASTSSLKIYMGGTTFALGGNGLANESGNAANFQYFGLETNRSVTFSGNGDFIGCIYAPTADFYLGGGGAGEMDFVGASVTKTVKMNGSYNFHYDENLRNIGPGRGYIPTNWREA